MHPESEQFLEFKSLYSLADHLNCDLDQLQNELNVIKPMIKDENLKSIIELYEKLRPYKEAFPTVMSMITGALTIPVSSTTCERSFNYPEAKKEPANTGNYRRGRKEKIKGVVLHGTAGPNAVQWFKNPKAKVSAHYVVEKDGRVIQMVSEDDTAWHAGVVSPNSKYAKGPNPNSWLIGIEFSRDRNNANKMPEVQIKAGLKLVKDMKRRYGKQFGVYTHDQFETTRTCPGPKFPVKRFKDAIKG
ncbi:unnamed protein product [Rotaria sordida]|uniref:N-acetylmuramoyl-L-alanine amidase n=1 Tax=Rotaria sordida TaxID=392033 RepID=A0A819KBU7_9BILA|nr:unnamed protein product [Rotaria sordida]CAF1143997.1 unnamed protein product [Rotaria sordida]CAF1399635.1 unnamed protein product [Rotaria sordida]CAF1410945.1 unnamed protein product [Rotaria sordida]CAF1458696.1 unnamed protein product [Rotaria sordida]